MGTSEHSDNSVESQTNAPPAGTGDDFGLWLKSGASGKPAGSGSEAPPASPSPPKWSVHRAGRGPLASVVSAWDGGPVLLPKAPGGDSPLGEVQAFHCLDRLAGLATVTLVALILAGAHAVHSDVKSVSAMATLTKQDEAIEDYNRSRNILVQHLARQKTDRLARLRSYADWMDERQEQGVVVFMPAEGGQPIRKSVVKVDFGDLRKQVADDIDAIKHWDAPPPIEGYGHMTFQRADLFLSRVPVLGTLALSMLVVMAWSYYAYRNLDSLQAPPTSDRPWYVPLCWLMPVGNLFLPCALMGEIWHGSDPDKLRKANRLRLPVVGFWWLAILAGSWLVLMGVLKMTHAIGIHQMLGSIEFVAYGDIGVMVIGVATILLVVAASLNQTRRRRLVEKFESQFGLPQGWARQPAADPV